VVFNATTTSQDIVPQIETETEIETQESETNGIEKGSPEERAKVEEFQAAWKKEKAKLDEGKQELIEIFGYDIKQFSCTLKNNKE
jgi:hypothetical protein